MNSIIGWPICDILSENVLRMEHLIGEIAKIDTTDRTFKDGYLSSQLSIQWITKYAGTQK